MLIRALPLLPLGLMHRCSTTARLTARHSRHQLLMSAGSPRRLSKRLLILRHGQAMHNPRAEAARHAGCTYDEFIELMREDDVLDAPLTALGEDQARQIRQHSEMRKKLDETELVVSSTLSRAIQTADLVLPRGLEALLPTSPKPRRVSLECFREINGMLLNAKRRKRSDLEQMFGGAGGAASSDHWDFSHLSSEDDDMCTEELESEASCAERGYQGLIWLMKQWQDNLLLVAHGGLLKFLLVDHPSVNLVDGRLHATEKEQSIASLRSVEQRFGNCELREFTISLEEDGSLCRDKADHRPVITIVEVTNF